jgi:intracellular sulfur oxidation DsrE/DsrF family protein
MNQDDKFSDEYLNAFVDDQLTPEEREQVYARLSQDDALKQRVCQLRQVSDLVSFAYKQLPQPAPGLRTAKAGKWFGLGLAAGLALAVSAVAGWLLYPSSTPNTGSPVTQAASPSAASIASANDVEKVLIHISDGQPLHLKNALDEVENLMRFYRKSNQHARVEVITNGDGLNLLLAETTTYAARIGRMQKEYAGLTFVACQNTIDRLKNELGVSVKLLPGVVVVDSGVAQIMRRQHQGWAYIQV